MESHDNIDLIFCSFVPVGFEDYVHYFINNFNNFAYLKWKFHHIKSPMKSSISIYQAGKKISEREIFTAPVFSNKFIYFSMLPIYNLIYLIQALTLLWSPKSSNLRIFIGVNYFCTFCGLILKKLGRVDFVIYRVVDFFPLPPNGVYRYLLKIFYIIDKICLNSSDYIWFTTEGHISGREKYGYFDRNGRNNYLLIQLGLDTDKAALRPVDEVNRFSLVYCGIISKYHMIDQLFQIMNELKRDFKNIQLNLIGSGPDENFFRDLAKKMNLQDNVIFHGFLEEGEAFTEIMTNNILGIALYRDEENFMKYTEPAKVKYYLSYGIPALVSTVPAIAKELDHERVSFAVRNNNNEIIELIRDFINSPGLQQEYKENIKKYIKKIDIKLLLDKALFKTFSYLKI